MFFFLFVDLNTYSMPL